MSNFIPSGSYEEDFVNLVRLELDDVKHSFFKIGFRLKEANDNKYYLKLGYENIADCAEALFGFKKSTTYELIDISFWFRNRETPMFIDKKYDKYSQSQLALFCTINLARDSFIRMCSPGDTILKMRKAKKYWNAMQRGKLQSFLGYGRCETLDEFIQQTEACNPQLCAPVKEDIIVPEEKTKLSPGEPGYLLQEAKKLPPDPSFDDAIKFLDKVIKEPKVAKEETSEHESIEPESENLEENSGRPEKITEMLIKHLTAYYSHMCYKTIFDPDNKGFGVKVMPDDLSQTFVQEMLHAIQDKRTAIKHQIQKYITNRMSDFRYEITLCGRKQGIPTLCGNMASWMLDFLCEEWQSMLPEKKVKKNDTNI